MSKRTVSHALLVLGVTHPPPGLLHPLQLQHSHKSLGKKSQWISRVPLARNPPTMVIAVLVVVDLLTRLAEMIPIHNKSAKTVASALIQNVFCQCGIPESILTDHGCEFDNQAISTIAHELGIHKKRISALHPQANGIVERLNRTIGEMLRKTTDQCGDNWDLQIPFVQSRP